MIFVQGYLVDNDLRKDNSLSNSDDKDLKVGDTNQDRVPINLANTCPRGLACVFPGRCTLYSDSDYDKTCDRANLENNYNGRGL